MIKDRVAAEACAAAAGAPQAVKIMAAPLPRGMKSTH